MDYREAPLTCSSVAPEARLTEGARPHPRGDLVGPRGTRATRHLTSAAENVNVAYNNSFKILHNLPSVVQLLSASECVKAVNNKHIRSSILNFSLLCLLIKAN